MALLDVSEILLDPDFMDHGLQCERNVQTVGSNGLSQNVTTLLPFSGVVTTNEGDVMERMSFGERIKGSIIVHSVFELQDGADGLTADIVRWKGRRYTVTRVSSYKHFGRGFVAAECDIIPFTG